jgi:hypothetical protein
LLLAEGSGGFSNVTLSPVTSGEGTSNQTMQVLGSFSDENPSGWQAYHTVPLLDTNGNKVAVQLGGKATLRLMAPATATPASEYIVKAVPSVFVLVSMTGGQIQSKLINSPKLQQLFLA